MSRWIDADALKEKIDNIWDGRPLSFLGARILAMIDDAPSLDLVRCAECKHHEDFPTGISPITCSLSWGGVFENDFCSYGEREE